MSSGIPAAKTKPKSIRLGSGSYPELWPHAWWLLSLVLAWLTAPRFQRITTLLPSVSVPGTHSCHQRLPGSKSLKLGISPQYDLRIPKIIIFVVSPESPSLSKSPLLSKHFVIPLLLTLKLAWQLGSSRSAGLSTKHRSSLKRFRKNLKDQELKRVQH